VVGPLFDPDDPIGFNRWRKRPDVREAIDHRRGGVRDLADRSWALVDEA
jgi:hypothetical protein